MNNHQLELVECSQCGAIPALESQGLAKEMPAVVFHEAKGLGWVIGHKTEEQLCPHCVKEMHNIWRLPSRNELVSLLWENPITNREKFTENEDLNEDDYFLNSDGLAAYLAAFPSGDRQFWSSTENTRSVSQTSAWTVRFDVGYQVPISKKGRSRVRLVRALQAKKTWQFGDPLCDRYTVSVCCGFVTDNCTGLQWKREEESDRLNWLDTLERFDTPRIELKLENNILVAKERD
ncbi:DUF1566 domain-containing protein [Vibrio sp. 10N.261.46.E12]|uniref:Lcl C-terminal domain-containing protein n=1 Tax=unclassified Vibrio TaxID=2614977 RepID=UPI00097894D0|nr:MULTISPECIES: DUF1566 domain-containing protein [unclassified Vibrio]OMO36239.1 hypothetical protein BH584_05535 [Vibrio sp. 10N.261.45.E1]PMJ34409.1 hypothetical protein BCU27_03000 [Vibrio sp. 10N.286.45.B6]PML86780.1 hypothetical protein BCT66_00705 [Vibrio sp. 10N.261.49.E11]PMM76780.1 hypothetical protein BCT48_24580 [Vibrio sp. 10N.261.46.F12]PMM81852.1 hypothetical protein BCT46_15715 [Vibrio sp. 10N.261.46.E8]